MQRIPSWLRPQISRVAAALIVIFLFFQARVTDISAAERAQISSRFHFTRLVLPSAGGAPVKTNRVVQPSLRRISAWISSVGAAVAAGDLDGDGLSNDICLVDPRTDLVTIAPAPGTGNRYQPFALLPAKYDASTSAPMGCLIADVNEDGKADVVVYYWGRTPVAFLRQSGLPGHAEALTAAS